MKKRNLWSYIKCKGRGLKRLERVRDFSFARMTDFYNEHRGINPVADSVMKI